jgi:hypothetical protein
MKRRVGVVAVLSLLGCAGPRAASEAPGKSVVPLTAPDIATTESAIAVPNDASMPDSGTSEVSAAMPALGLVEHEYHRVFQGWSFLLTHNPEPYLISAEGAVNLTTGVVDFERDASNWTAYQGDSLWFADHFSPMSACPEPATLVQLTGKKWVPRLEANVHSLVVQPWVKGSSLAAVVPLRSGPPWGYELTVLERNRTAPRPARRSAYHLPECETRIAWFQTLVAFGSGEVFAFGSECETQPLPEEIPDDLPDRATEDDAFEPERPTLPQVLMESWNNGRHEFSEVPFRELGQVIGIGPKDIWAVGTKADDTWAVAHFDGTAWQFLPEYYDNPISALRIYPEEKGGDARRLILMKQQLLEINNGVTTAHALPPNCVARDVTLDGEELWVECYADDQVTLYTTRKGIAEFRFDTDAPDRKLVTFTDKAYPRLDPKAASLRSCGSREFEVPKPEPQQMPGSKPLPYRSKSNSKLNRDVDFGF